ncbi:MAG TPA: hypothetical protein VJ227_01540 [Patescibacteria group bacterium]|nr:hypothetical protein [Patescibacteria group bacterium]
MRKELVWAAVIGIIFGLIIAFGAWRISKRPGPTTAETTPTPAPVAGELKITLDKPQEGDVLTQDTVSVSGITKSLSWVTVSAEKGDYIVQSQENGVFAQEVDLIAGVNWIRVSVFDSEGSQSVEKVLVVYSSSFEEKTLPSPTPSTVSTESAIRQKVAEKVAEALNKPKAYIGTVTDIADSTIEIKTIDSEIKQVSTAEEEVSVINQKGTNNKAVKLTDIAIGDFIVAMGYVNSKSVLLAQRILITDPVTEPKITAAYGTVTATSKNSITVTTFGDNQEKIISPTTKTDIEVYQEGKFILAKFANIGANDLVIYIIDADSETPSVRSVFIVEKAQG